MPKQGKFTLKTTFKITTFFIGATLLVSLVSTALFWGLGQVEKSAEVRKHTNIVINYANQLLSALKDAETGQRGYTLTGVETFLEPYLAVRDSIGGDLEQLRQLTSGSSSHQYVETVAPLIDAKLAEMAQVIELRRHRDATAALALVSSGQGKQLMDKIRAEVNVFTQTEEVELAKHEATYQSNMRRLFITILVVCLLVLLLAFSFAYLIYRQTQQRLQNLIHLETQHLLKIQEEMNAKLQQTNDTLQVSEERLAVTLSSIGDAVITTNAEARITLLNPFAEQITGWTQEEANGRSVDEVFHIINKDTRALATIPVFETLTCGTIQGLANHTVLIARDGSEYDIADSCAPIRDRNAQVIGAILVFRDVTKEYLVQQTVRDSAAQIQTILNTVMDGIITIQATDGIIKTANPATEKIFSCTTTELLGQNVSTLIFEPEQNLRNAKNFLDDCIINDEMHANGREVVGQRMDGSIFPMEIALNEMWLNGQRYFTGILRDITARKLAEKGILETDALQNAIFNSATFSSIATDAKGVIQIFNVGAERMLGYAADEVINKMTPAELSDSQEMIARAQTLSNEFGTLITAGFEALVFKAARGIEDIYELTYLRKDGSFVPAVVSVTALRDIADMIIGYLLISTDNTTRKAIEVKQQILEQRLRDHQFYTRSLFEANIDALITTDPSGVITDVNKQMEILTSCTRDELIGSPFKNYFTDLEAAETGIKLVLTHKNLTNYELTARAIDGKETIVSCNATTFYDRNRQLQGVFAAARDITERKKLDQLLQDKNVELEAATVIAEKANLAKSDFLSNMSHELRDPLTAILGFAQLLESALPPPSPEQTERIAEILRAGWHLLALINDILDLTKIESKNVSISEESVLLSEVMAECQSMMELQAQQQNITLTFPVFSSDCFIRADRTRLKQVIINLISNAIKYNRPDGSVIVNCIVDSVTEFTRISITDTGIGLSPENIAQLFQRFNRLGQEFSGVSGTGIGLVVVKRLVELMHGVMGVESTVDVGSVFWVELPSVATPYLSVESDIEILVTPQLFQNAEQHTLLYIDDNPVNLKLIGQILAGHADISLQCELNATAGIEKAREMLPDVILMDINMPVINGFEALKILRADETTVHIPVIAFSANAMSGDIKKGLEAGFFRYITKPINVNEFIAALDETLQRSRLLGTIKGNAN